MESFWPNKFNIEEVITPSEILKKQAEFLPKLTNSMIFAEVLNLSENYYTLEEYKETEFCFQFVLKSKYMEKYKFDILTVFHDVDIYPLYVYINDDIKKEIGYEKKYNGITIESENEFNKILKDVLQSKKLEKVVSNLMSLSDIPDF